MTDADAIARASNAGFLIYGEPWRWYWAAKYEAVDSKGAFDTAAEAWEDICRSYPAAGEDDETEAGS
jgi:hypothetical protein